MHCNLMLVAIFCLPPVPPPEPLGSIADLLVVFPLCVWLRASQQFLIFLSSSLNDFSLPFVLDCPLFSYLLGVTEKPCIDVLGSSQQARCHLNLPSVSPFSSYSFWCFIHMHSLILATLTFLLQIFTSRGSFTLCSSCWKQNHSICKFWGNLRCTEQRDG